MYKFSTTVVAVISIWISRTLQWRLNHRRIPLFEAFERDNAERNTFIAHTSPGHQDPLENWRDGTASAFGHMPALGRTPE